MSTLEEVTSVDAPRQPVGKAVRVGVAVDVAVGVAVVVSVSVRVGVGVAVAAADGVSVAVGDVDGSAPTDSDADGVAVVDGVPEHAAGLSTRTLALTTANAVPPNSACACCIAAKPAQLLPTDTDTAFAAPRRQYATGSGTVTVGRGVCGVHEHQYAGENDPTTTPLSSTVRAYTGLLHSTLGANVSIASLMTAPGAVVSVNEKPVGCRVGWW